MFELAHLIPCRHATFYEAAAHNVRPVDVTILKSEIDEQYAVGTVHCWIRRDNVALLRHWARPNEGKDAWPLKRVVEERCWY